MTRTLLSVVLLILSLSACGGGGNGGVPVERPQSGVSGVATLANAPVQIYAWDAGERGELLGDTTTDSQGNYQIDLQTPDGLIEIVVGGAGRYVEPSSDVSVSLRADQFLTTVTPYVSGQPLTAHVTPFTHFAACLADYQARNGESPADALDSANSTFSSGTGIDVVATRPVDVTDPENISIDLTPGLEYRLLIAGVSQAMADVSAANGIPPHSARYATSAQFAEIGCQDLRADGVFNGEGFIDSNDTIGDLAIGATAVRARLFRTVLSQQTLAFVHSDRNETGLNIEAVLSFANALSTSADAIFNGLPAEPVDADGPSVTAGLAAGSFIAETTTLPFSITDPVGVRTVAFFIDNSGPSVNVTSPLLSGTTSYIASGTFLTPGSSIASITVNGVSATLNTTDQTWEAAVSLIGGPNTLEVVANDRLGNSTERQVMIGVDLVPPAIETNSYVAPFTLFDGQFGRCDLRTFDQTTPSNRPLCLRIDRTSLDGASINRNLITLEYLLLDFDVSDPTAAGVSTAFSNLVVEYRYERNGTEQQSWPPVMTGVGETSEAYLLPLTTEYLGEAWARSGTTDEHLITIRVTDEAGNTSELPYTVMFDLLVPNTPVVATDSTADVFCVGFAQRQTIDGSTVRYVLTLTNTTRSPFYLDVSGSYNHAVSHTHETAIRRNRARQVIEEQWRMRTYLNRNSDWALVSGAQFYGSAWSNVFPAPIVRPAFADILSDVLPTPSTTPWGNHLTYRCGAGQFFESGREGDFSNTINLVALGLNPDRNLQRAACVASDATGVVSHNAFQARTVYTAEYEPGFPRNDVTLTSTGYTVLDNGITVINSADGQPLNVTSGFYEVPPETEVQVIKTLRMPILTHFGDAEIANLATFSSYNRRQLDQRTDWTLDGEIVLGISGTTGASRRTDPFGGINTFTIGR